jgi:hypothetical protein
LARRLALAGVLALAAAAPAAAQTTPVVPSLQLDTRFATGDGVARDDLNGTLTDIPSGVAVHGDRIVVVGESRDSSSNSDVGIVARRANGALDTSFSGDGRLLLPVAADTGKDVGQGVLALPDGRLRVLVSTDTTPGTGTNIDAGVVGLRPDGSFDTTFGGGDGIVTFATGAGEDKPKRMTLAPGGRLVIGGARSDGAKEDSWVALLEPDGSPAGGFGTNGVVAFDRAGPQLNDGVVDVDVLPSGSVLALLQVETNPDASLNDFRTVVRALTPGGQLDGAFGTGGEVDLTDLVGQPDTVPGAVLVHAGRVWVSGATKAGNDTDAFLARMGTDGGDVQSRRFDFRGASVAADQLVTSAASDLAVVGGLPETIVATGSVNVGSRPYWGAAVFSGLGGHVAAMPTSDLVVPTDEYGAINGVAAGPGWVGVAGSLVDTQQNFDTSFGTARLLVDPEKACDLAMDVVRPLEAQLVPGGTTELAVEVRNAGTRPCAGVVSVPAPYGLGGATAVPVLDPGGVHRATLVLRHDGPLRRTDAIDVAVTAPGDANAANDKERLAVAFRWCDPRIDPLARPAWLPSEGTLGVAVTVRNGGTVQCRRVRVAAQGARRGDVPVPYALAVGRSATERVRLAAPQGARRGARVAVALSGRADAPLAPASAVRWTARVATVGDSAVRAATARSVRGRATPGDPALGKAARAVRGVDVAAFRRVGKRCEWLAAADGRLARGSCGAPRWVRASGRAAWRLRLGRALPAGTWTVRSRAVLRNGFAEARFGRADGNERRLRVG